jgi:hypothetical protein
MKKINCFLLLIIIVFTFSSCSKKGENIESLTKNKDYKGLAKIISLGKKDVKTLTSAGITLIKLKKTGMVVTALKSLESHDDSKAIDTANSIGKNLITLLKSKNDILAKDALCSISDFLNKDISAKAGDEIVNWYTKDFDKKIFSGGYEIKIFIEKFWKNMSKQSRIQIAKLHSDWMLKDFKKRSDEGVVIQRRGDVRKKKLNRKMKIRKKIYVSYFKVFRNQTVLNLIKNYSTTKPKKQQLRELLILDNYANKKEKKQAGEKIIELMKKTNRATLVSIRALGDFKPKGATSYLKQFIKPKIHEKLHLAAHEALILLTDYPESLEILLLDFNPLLKSLNKNAFPDKTSLKYASSALRGIALPRSCKLDASNYKLYSKLLKKKLKPDLKELRDQIKPALYQLLICTGKEKGIIAIIDSINFPVKLIEATKIVLGFEKIDKKLIRKTLRKMLKSKKLNRQVFAVLGLNAFGNKKDVVYLKKLMKVKVSIPKWGKTVGKLTEETITLINKR